MNILKLVFNIYHLLFVSINRTCRFEPTCSQYFIDAVGKYGTLKGCYLGAIRIISCNPLSKKPSFDPA